MEQQLELWAHLCVCWRGTSENSTGHGAWNGGNPRQALAVGALKVRTYPGLVGEETQAMRGIFSR